MQTIRRVLCSLICLLLLCALVPTAVFAAADKVRITGYRTKEASYTSGGLYFYLFLDTDIHNARHFQTTERKPEADVPEDSWDFPDALTDAARKYILINGTPLGDYLDVQESPWGMVFCYEKAKDFDGRQTLTIMLDPAVVPSVDPSADDFTIEIKNGMITAELKRLEACTMQWDHKTRKLIIRRAGDGGLTLDEVEAGVKPTASTGKTTAGSVKTTAAGTPTAGTAAATTAPAEPSAPGTTDATEPVIGTTVGELPLSASDVTTDDADIRIDLTGSRIVLSRAMKVSELAAALKVNAAYRSGVYNGTNEVDPDSAVYSGFRFKIYDGDDLIGSLRLEAPAAEDGNTGAVIAIVIAAVAVAAGAAAAVILLRRRNAKKGANAT